MTDTTPATPLTIALPKGRLQEQVQELFRRKGIEFSFENRKLVALDKSGGFQFFLVKNSDLPTYVNHGIAGLGFCGEDVLYEHGGSFIRLSDFPFGGTSMCIAGKKGGSFEHHGGTVTVATKFTSFTRDYFHKEGLPVEIIKLNGSVELAPVLGLAPYIVDLVETGTTLKANNLEVYQKLSDIKVYLIANPAYYKLYYRQINAFTQKILASTADR
ncbi:MAG: ATP phosphoribosyltransferase [Spirochaetales bacterium]|nr:ATP phosphoribosyltransferase [Spirochaetales bacterium]